MMPTTIPQKTSIAILVQELHYLQKHFPSETEILQKSLKILAFDVSHRAYNPAHPPILNTLSKLHPRPSIGAVFMSGLLMTSSLFVAFYACITALYTAFFGNNNRHNISILTGMAISFTAIAAGAAPMLKHALFPTWLPTHTEASLETINEYYQASKTHPSSAEAFQGKEDFAENILKQPNAVPAFQQKNLKNRTSVLTH